MITASICTIGDEILIGQITDTNSGNIARALGEKGIRTARMLSIGDDYDTIISNLKAELSSNDIVIATGGLGPTKDDITKGAIAELTGSKKYIRNVEQEGIVHAILKSRGLDVMDINLAQADVPENCDVILNRLGTAPIMAKHFPEEEFGHEAVLISMPGVPYEMQGALPDVLEYIDKAFKLENITHRTIMTYGIAESALSEKIAGWEDNLPDNMHLAYLPNQVTGVRLRLSIYGGDNTENLKSIENQLDKLGQIVGEYIYSKEDDTLQNVIRKILKANGQTLSTAESCTGGNIAHLITTVPGSSDVFLGGVISYAPEVKINVLGVKAETIEKFGIVSSQVASEMAEGVRKLTGSTYSVSTTGWADSYGDDKEPAGTVWVAVSGPSGTVSSRFHYKSSRTINIDRFSASALNLLRLYILQCTDNKQN